MADYFTNLSLIIPLPDQAAQTNALNLAIQASEAYQSDEPPINLPASISEVIEDWRFTVAPNSQPNNWGLWVHSEQGGVDAVCAFIQHLLQLYNPQGRVTFEWSHDCSKARVDAYGGGAAIVTAQNIKTMNTGQWLPQHAA